MRTQAEKGAAFRAPMGHDAHAPHTASVLEKLAREQPRVLACMHGVRGGGMERGCCESIRNHRHQQVGIVLAAGQDDVMAAVHAGGVQRERARLHRLRQPGGAA